MEEENNWAFKPRKKKKEKKTKTESVISMGTF